MWVCIQRNGSQAFNGLHEIRQLGKSGTDYDLTQAFSCVRVQDQQKEVGVGGLGEKTVGPGEQALWKQASLDLAQLSEKSPFFHSHLTTNLLGEKVGADVCQKERMCNSSHARQEDDMFIT